jgi:hypothetical protein
MKAMHSLSGGAAQFCFKCMENAWKQLNFVSNAWKKCSRILMEFQSKNREPLIMKWKFSINILKYTSKNEKTPFFIEQCEHIFRVGLPNVVVLMYFVHLE